MTVGPGIAPGLLVPEAPYDGAAGARGLVPPSPKASEGITAGGELHPALRTQTAGPSDGKAKIGPFRRVKQVFERVEP